MNLKFSFYRNFINQNIELFKLYDKFITLSFIRKSLTVLSTFRVTGSSFGQRINIAIQIGNAACLLGTSPDHSDMEEYFVA